jgi:hypothetical protein
MAVTAKNIQPSKFRLRHLCQDQSVLMSIKQYQEGYPENGGSDPEKLGLFYQPMSGLLSRRQLIFDPRQQMVPQE